jgi:hypothetical protein
LFRSPLGALLFKGAAVAGAGALGFWAGTKLYENFDVEILDGLEFAVEKVKSFIDWVGEKLGRAKQIGSDIKDRIDQFVGAGKYDPNAMDEELRAGSPPDPSKNATSTALADPTQPARMNMGRDGKVKIQNDAVSASPADARRADKNVEDLDIASRAKKFTKGSGNISQLNPAVRERFLAMAEAYYKATGKQLYVESAFRTRERQQQLRDQFGSRAAPPGTSLHEKGMALDLNRNQAGELEGLGLLGKFGFERPIAKEPWHIQASGVLQEMAKQGVYSSDYTSNQTGVVPQGGNTSAVPSEFKMPPAAGESPSSSGSATETQPQGGSIGASQKVGGMSFPLFKDNDGSLLAMNVGALGMA